MSPPADKRKALGRGLSALIPGASASGIVPTVKRDYFVVAIEEVYPSRQNPRRDFFPRAGRRGHSGSGLSFVSGRNGRTTSPSRNTPHIVSPAYRDGMLSPSALA